MAGGTPTTRHSVTRRWVYMLSAVALFAAVVVWSTQSFAQSSGMSPVERELPTFDLPDLEKQQWTPATLKGKPWVINFWATWCPPCIEEMPSMNEAWKTLEGQGVGMLAINAGEGEEAVTEFLKKVAIDFPVLLGDAAGTLPNWSVRGLPTTVVVDAEGNVVFEALGPREWNDDEIIEQILSVR